MVSANEGFLAVTGAGAGQGVITAWGRANVFESTDAGATWRAVRLPRKTRALEAQFPNARAGFVMSTAERLFATRNGGKTWRELFAGTDDISGMSMATQQAGFFTTMGGDAGVRFGRIVVSPAKAEDQAQLCSQALSRCPRFRARATREVR